MTPPATSLLYLFITGFLNFQHSTKSNCGTAFFHIFNSVYLSCHGKPQTCRTEIPAQRLQYRDDKNDKVVRTCSFCQITQACRQMCKHQIEAKCLRQRRRHIGSRCIHATLAYCHFSYIFLPLTTPNFPSTPNLLKTFLHSATSNSATR